MTQIIVADRQGEEQTIDFTPGDSLMRAITGAGMGDLLALCGGVCSCATCHVYIDNAFVDALAPISSDEDGLLESLGHRQANSRLSCQVSLGAELDGLRATIAPAD